VLHTDAGWFGGKGCPTRARRFGAGWRLDGVKAFAPLASKCRRFLVTAETESGLHAFIVDAQARGVSCDDARGTLGLRALEFADVKLEAVEAERLTQDWRRIVDSSRIALTAILSGIARAAYDYALPYAKQRVVHGEAIGRKQAIAFKLADMHIETQAMRWMGLRAASELDAAPTATRAARLAQRYAAEHAVRVTDEGVQVFGGHGFVRDLPLEMWYRNARTLSVLDGLVGA
jgi:alkylation response protein AidB-like acyl-CoA dehydrogenase